MVIETISRCGEVLCLVGNVPSYLLFPIFHFAFAFLSTFLLFFLYPTEGVLAEESGEERYFYFLFLLKRRALGEVQADLQLSMLCLPGSYLAEGRCIRVVRNVYPDRVSV